MCGGGQDETALMIRSRILKDKGMDDFSVARQARAHNNSCNYNNNTSNNYMTTTTKTTTMMMVMMMMMIRAGGLSIAAGRARHAPIIITAITITITIT